MGEVPPCRIVTHVRYYLRWADEIGRPPTLEGYHRWRFSDSPTAVAVRQYGWDRAVTEARAAAS